MFKTQVTMLNSLFSGPIFVKPELFSHNLLINVCYKTLSYVYYKTTDLSFQAKYELHANQNSADQY